MDNNFPLTRFFVGKFKTWNRSAVHRRMSDVRAGSFQRKRKLQVSPAKPFDADRSGTFWQTRLERQALPANSHPRDSMEHQPEEARRPHVVRCNDSQTRMLP